MEPRAWTTAPAPRSTLCLDPIESEPMVDKIDTTATRSHPRRGCVAEPRMYACHYRWASRDDGLLGALKGRGWWQREGDGAGSA